MTTFDCLWPLRFRILIFLIFEHWKESSKATDIDHGIEYGFCSRHCEEVRTICLYFVFQIRKFLLPATKILPQEIL